MIELDGERAAWLQVARHIRERIASGDLAAGSRAPSAKRVAQEYDVSDSTASRALHALCDEGVIELHAAAKVRYIVDRPPKREVVLRKGDEVEVFETFRGERHKYGLGEGESRISVRRAAGETETYGSRSARFVVR